MTSPLSGTQFELASGDYRASIASVGASLRQLTWRGRDLVVPFAADTVRPAFRGATLAPWPNRVIDGRYEFGGVEHQLSITEPERFHALHGLVAWQQFERVDASASQVTLQTVIQAQSGYPFPVSVTVTFALDDTGLHTTVVGENLGSRPAPWGTGPHPYLVAGVGHVDDWTLELPAAAVLTVTPERLIPTGLNDVSAESEGAFDFRAPKPIGSLFIDHAFSGLVRDESGRASVRLTDESGSGVQLTWGAECRWVQVHTADLPRAADSRLGLAVEPMTCPPAAFNSGTDLTVLAPGGSARAGWTIAAI